MRGDIFSRMVDKVPFLKLHYRGAWPRHRLPAIYTAGSFFLINTDPDPVRGQHWLIVFYNANRKYEIFDSLGQAQSVLQHLFYPGDKVKYNIQAYQSADSQACGEFCFYFIYHRICHYSASFEVILRQIFSKNTADNEARATSFCNSLRGGTL